MAKPQIESMDDPANDGDTLSQPFAHALNDAP